MGYKLPNRKGRRSRKSSFVIMDKTKLTEFKRIYPEHSNLSLKEFNEVVKYFNDEIINTVIENRDGVLLPEKIGQMLIVSFPKPKRKIIDFGKSNKTGVKHYHGNWDTDNKIAKIIYHNKVNNYGNKYSKFWGFIPARNFKMDVSDKFKKYWQRYICVDNKNSEHRKNKKYGNNS
jgi:hypothetical protein